MLPDLEPDKSCRCVDASHYCDMNQDSFRELIKVSPSSLIPPRVGKHPTRKATNVSQPAFQPRKVKTTKSNSSYRDRASERRAGLNDYAQVESILEDFEQRTATVQDRDVVEEQRRYLGGDKDHTILVKGLDFALLEQNKARTTASHADDDSLETAFQESQAKSVVPRKRTRDDLLRELKDKRAASTTQAPAQEREADDAFEEAKKIGKFKPIGTSERLKDNERSKMGRGKEQKNTTRSDKKKKPKVRPDLVTANDSQHRGIPQAQKSMPTPPEHANSSSPKTVGGVLDESEVQRPESMAVESDGEVNIFADAGEYEGLVFEDEDVEGPDNVGPDKYEERAASSPTQLDNLPTTGDWFGNDEHKTIPEVPIARPPTPPAAKPASPEPEDSRQTKLIPLASSALPSISDFLAMDAQAEAFKKKQARKQKKKGDKKEKESTELKAEKDYKKLNSYMSKKGGV